MLTVVLMKIQVFSCIRWLAIYKSVFLADKALVVF